MLITRETDYAIRIIRALSDGELITTGEICKRELLPKQFVYKILKKLERAGLVQIVRGAEGGCRLTANLKQISLFDLVQIMDSKRQISSCMEPDFQCTWKKSKNSECNVHKHLLKIQSALDEQLRIHSLHDLIFTNCSF